MKQYINGFLIVEGTNDKSYISSFFDAEIICTNGFDVESEELAYVLELSKKMQPIILVDSDESGKQIRKKLNNLIPNAINVEVDINKCNKNRKHGVAECEKEELFRCLETFTIDAPKKVDKYSPYNLIELGIYSIHHRDVLCSRFHLGKCNAKQLAHRLSLLEIKKEDILKVLKEE